MNGDEDTIFVKTFKFGDERAFDHLFEKYNRSLYSICYRFTRNDADARELTQDIFIKVYRNLKNFNEKSKFFTWLYRIAVNTCISFKRKKHIVLSEERTDSSNFDESRPFEKSLDERIRMKIAIDDALARVPERQRMAFILHHYDGYKFDEIGTIMGITTGAAKANYHQAIKKLRIFLKDWI